LAIGLAFTPAQMLRGETTISFRGILEDAPFTLHTEEGFEVSALVGAWRSSTDFGNPPPYIYFQNSDGQSDVVAAIRITRPGGAPFGFGSVDVYSSITPIPFVFAGYLDSQLVFDVSGTVPNTYGNFVTAPNPEDRALIDTLEIEFTNPSTPCCPGNPMGLDSIVVIPELGGDRADVLDYHAHWIQRLHIAYFGRPAEPEEGDFWVDWVAEAGGDLAVVWESLGRSSEYLLRYAHLEGAELVEALYLEVLGRHPDEAGWGFWTGQLDSGAQTLFSLPAALMVGARHLDEVTLAHKAVVAAFYTEKRRGGCYFGDLSDARALLLPVDARAASLESALDQVSAQCP
jgi:hypothetical protein